MCQLSRPISIDDSLIRKWIFWGYSCDTVDCMFENCPKLTKCWSLIGLTHLKFQLVVRWNAWFSVSWMQLEFCLIKYLCVCVCIWLSIIHVRSYRGFIKQPTANTKCFHIALSETSQQKFYFKLFLWNN